jgi:hypothetical protein
MPTLTAKARKAGDVGDVSGGLGDLDASPPAGRRRVTCYYRMAKYSILE